MADSTRDVAPVTSLISAQDSRESRAQTSRPERLAARIARVVERRTSGRIRNLKVEVRQDGVVLEGYCATYYLKQLAQHAAMELTGGKPIVNEIQAW